MTHFTLHVNGLRLPDRSAHIPPQWYSSVDGTIFVELNGTCFPEDRWFDLPLSVLEMWSDQLCGFFRHPGNQPITLRFMDGPFAVRLSPVSSQAAAVAFLEDNQVIPYAHPECCIDLAAFAWEVQMRSSEVVAYCEANGEHKLCAALEKSAKRLKVVLQGR